MSIGGGSEGDPALAVQAKQDSKRANHAYRDARRLSRKIERKGEAFFDEWIADQLPNIGELAGNIQKGLGEMDIRAGDLGKLFGDLGQQIQDSLPEYDALRESLNPYRDALGQLGAAVQGVTAETELAYQDAREKQRLDDEQYEQEGRPVFGEYAGKVRQVANSQVDVRDKITGAMGDVEQQTQLAQKNMDRELKSRGLQPNQSITGQNNMTAALGKAFAANAAREQGNATNRALDAQGVNMMANLNQAGQQLDKNAQNNAIGLANLNAQTSQAGAAGSLTQAQAGIVGQQAGLLSTKNNQTALAGDVAGKELNAIGMQQGLKQTAMNVQGQQIEQVTGAQTAMLNPLTAALSGQSSIYSTSSAAASSNMQANAKIASAENQADAKGTGQILGLAMSAFL